MIEPGGAVGEIPIRVLSTGVVRPKLKARGPRRYLPGGWSDHSLPVNVFAVQHPDGLCLFDAGQTAAAALPGYFPWWHPFFRLSRFELGPEDEAVSLLAQHGIGRPRWVVMSHLHTDHVGGLEKLRADDVVVSRGEWERAHGVRGAVRGYLPDRWPAALRPRVVDLFGPAVGPFSASYDLVGDGRLLLVPTPGHTPTHVSLLVRSPTRTYLLGGDLAHSTADLGRVAPAVAEFCRSDGVVFLATHDPAAASLVSGQT